MIEDNFIYKTSQQMIIKIINDMDKETLKVIQQYCEENKIIPNLINKDELDLILKLGIEEYKKRRC